MGAPKKVIPQKKHYCPKCNEVCQPVKIMPKSRMAFKCENEHYNKKVECSLR